MQVLLRDYLGAKVAAQPDVTGDGESITESVLERGRESAGRSEATLNTKLLKEATRVGVLQWSRAVSEIAEKALEQVEVGALRAALEGHPSFAHHDF